MNFEKVKNVLWDNNSDGYTFFFINHKNHSLVILLTSYDCIWVVKINNYEADIKLEGLISYSKPVTVCIHVHRASVYICRAVMVSCLFVGEHKEHCISQLVLGQHPHELLSCFIHAFSVITVHHKDQTWNSKENMLNMFVFFKRKKGIKAGVAVWLALLTLRVLKVVPPEGTDLVLPTHIPHSEADVLVLHCLHIKPWKEERRHASCKTRTEIQCKHA